MATFCFVALALLTIIKISKGDLSSCNYVYETAAAQGGQPIAVDVCRQVVVGGSTSWKKYICNGTKILEEEYNGAECTGNLVSKDDVTSNIESFGCGVQGSGRVDCEYVMRQEICNPLYPPTSYTVEGIITGVCIRYEVQSGPSTLVRSFEWRCKDGTAANTPVQDWRPNDGTCSATPNEIPFSVDNCLPQTGLFAVSKGCYIKVYGPTLDPTKAPSINPSKTPTRYPTGDPTSDPTKDPTSDPTNDPTIDPTIDPTKDPTSDPTKDPTSDPTPAPTYNPTPSPTYNPTATPTNAPIQPPTNAPIQHPTINPTVTSTNAPTQAPTNTPVASPTNAPTAAPINTATPAPTSNPTAPTTASGVISPRYQGSSIWADLSEGDKVLIKSYRGGYVNDNGDGSISTNPLYISDSQVWEITDEFIPNHIQFKNLNTGNFLKSNGANCISSSITGAGGAGSWTLIPVIVSGETFNYRRQYVMIKNNKHNECCRVSTFVDTSIKSNTCSSLNAYYTLEILEEANSASSASSVAFNDISDDPSTSSTAIILNATSHSMLIILVFAICIILNVFCCMHQIKKIYGSKRKKYQKVLSNEFDATSSDEKSQFIS